jgi:hypothetical protein
VIAIARGFAAGAIALTALLGAAAPAAAHGGATVTLNSDGVGAVWLTVTADDGHPIEDLREATVSAREAGGDTLAPQRMVTSSAPGTLVYLGTLAPGDWTVEVDLGPPVYRTCTAPFTVAPGGTAQTAPCDPPALAAPAAAPAPAGGGTDRLALWALAAATAGGVAIAAIAAVAFVTRRRR